MRYIRRLLERWRIALTVGDSELEHKPCPDCHLPLCKCEFWATPPLIEDKYYEKRKNGKTA